MEMRAIPLRFEQERVLKSILPIFDKQIIETRIGNTYAISNNGSYVSIHL